MPDWVPQVAPDFCPICEVYWECEHGIITSTIEIPPGPTRRLSPEEFAKLDTGEFIPSVMPKMNKAAWERLFRLQDWARDASPDPPFDPHVQPVLRYIDEDEDDA